VLLSVLIDWGGGGGFSSSEERKGGREGRRGGRTNVNALKRTEQINLHTHWLTSETIDQNTM